jgi:hypothetical protein
MKLLKDWKSFLAGAGAVLIVWAAKAATTFIVIGSMSTVNGTLDSTGVVVGTIAAPTGTFYIQNNGLSSTNALLVHAQFSLDNTNFITLSTYTPAGTNATTESWAPNLAAMTLYMRMETVTTNSVTVGGTFVRAN